MKLIKSALATFAALALLAGVSSCKSNQSTDNQTEVQQYATLSVDSLLSEAAIYVGDTVTVEGVCSHLCKHGGRKAFLAGTDGENVLRCEATSEIGGAFSPDCVGKNMTVSGIVCENRISDKEIAEMEEQYAQSQGGSDHACSTEAKAHGQDSISEFDARMADYRTRINERKEKEGKDYLSFYYLEAISYTTAE